MIYFDDLPLSEDILAALSELKIEYVFQPIFIQMERQYMREKH